MTIFNTARLSPQQIPDVEHPSTFNVSFIYSSYVIRIIGFLRFLYPSPHPFTSHTPHCPLNTPQHAYSHTHTHTHTHTQSLAHSPTHSLTHSLPHTPGPYCTTVHTHTHTHSHTQEDGILVNYIVTVCESRTRLFWLVLVFGYKAVIQGIGLFLALRIRNIKVHISLICVLCYFLIPFPVTLFKAFLMVCSDLDSETGQF